MPSVRTCSAAGWDHAIGPSVDTAKGCECVLHMANFSLHLGEVPKHIADESLCRAFCISQKSPLAKVHNSKLNGNAVLNGWKLVWLDMRQMTFCVESKRHNEK